MTNREVTIRLPEDQYLRLQQIAEATYQSLTEVLLHAIQAGLPPDWADVPTEFQADLALLNHFSDAALWQEARRFQTEDDMVRYQELLDKNADQTLTASEGLELSRLRTEADRFMLRKAHAVALLRWRGHVLPPADRLEQAP